MMESQLLQGTQIDTPLRRTARRNNIFMDAVGDVSGMSSFLLFAACARKPKFATMAMPLRRPHRRTHSLSKQRV
jgi:hypothetical protein